MFGASNWPRLAAVAAAAILAAVAIDVFDGPPEESKRLQRPWFERIPESERDRIHWLMFLERDGEHLGGISHSSSYDLHLHLATWKLEGESLELNLLQEDRIARYTVRTRHCADAPDGFDMCLDLEGEGEKCRFYGSSEWDRTSGTPWTIPAITPPKAKSTGPTHKKPVRLCPR